jgi:hypothetical protein
MMDILFPCGGKVCPITVIKAYVDESGTHQGSKVLLLSAYVGPAKEWKLLSHKFYRIDKSTGIPFHAVDCAVGGGDYQGMPNTRRYEITKKVIRAVNGSNVLVLGEAIYLDDYEEVNPRNGMHWETWLQPAFSVLFISILLDATSHIQDRYPGEKLSVCMDDSQYWYPLAASIFLWAKKNQKWGHEDKLETIAPYSQKQANELYAPDVLAYEGYLMKLRERYPTNHGPRESLRALLQKRKEGTMWSKEGLAKALVDYAAARELYCAGAAAK